MHFVFLVLMIISLSLQYVSRILSNESRSSLLFAKRTRSSAQNRALKLTSPNWNWFAVLSYFLARSLKKRLKSKGLRIHPCLTPRLRSKKSLLLFPFLTHALSDVYICFRIPLSTWLGFLSCFYHYQINSLPNLQILTPEV